MPTRYKISKPLSFITSVMFAIVGALVLTLRSDLAEMFRVPYTFTLAIGAVSFFQGIAMLLLMYLRGDLTPISRKIDDQTLDSTDRGAFSALISEIPKVSKSVEDLEERVKAVEDRPLNLKDLSHAERETLLSNLKTQLQNVLTSDLIKEIEQKYSSNIVESVQITQIRKSLELTSIRLRGEIDALTRRANLNLVIGALTTVVAVSLLAYLVLGSALSFTNIPDLLSHFIPRISIAIFIEVFSFFFLKLYKSSLQEIKYFQNELTNIEMKGIALESALLTLSNQLTNPIVEQLIRTDRNLITTQPSIEKDGKQLEPKDLADILDKIGKLLNLGGSK